MWFVGSYPSRINPRFVLMPDAVDMTRGHENLPVSPPGRPPEGFFMPDGDIKWFIRSYIRHHRYDLFIFFDSFPFTLKDRFT